LFVFIGKIAILALGMFPAIKTSSDEALFRAKSSSMVRYPAKKFLKEHKGKKIVRFKDVTLKMITSLDNPP
jgi:hypothetical protein